MITYWTVVRCLIFGAVIFLAVQGLVELAGVARSRPAIGAMIAGFLAIPQWVSIELGLKRGRR